LVSRRLAADLRRRAAQAAQRREQALLIEQQRSADLVARLARYEGRAPARQSSALRVALSRRLGTIGAIASSLARELKQSSAGSAEAVPEAARRTIARAEELARLATGGSPREQEAALRLVWPQVCDALANRLQSTHHLDAEIPEDLPPLMGTALEWEHVLSAVVENALDAMPGGGVVRLRAGRSDRPGLARIVVEDTGPGTPGDLLDRAGRADQPGLATVAALLEGLGGELLFMPTEGRGARVTIESPFYSRPLEPRPEPVKLDGTVLLADDDPDARRGMAKLLQSLGLQVLEADNGTLALARLRNEAPRFRAAVLDVVMEGTPVGDIVAGIREIRPGFPVLLISGFETRRFVDSVMALGGVRYLGKPVPREELIAALQDLFAIDPGQPQGSGR
ncbi:MAG: response regulator, partial [Gemmatimonadetes bacterium]|nr:response regulator [Gemmatimonadota bacterium]